MFHTTIKMQLSNPMIGNLYATPAFQRDFGYLYEEEYIISAPWQTGLSSQYTRTRQVLRT